MRILAAALVLSSFTQALPQSPAAHELDKLFSALGHAQSEADAKPLEEQIQLLFLQSGSPSVDLLMARAAKSLGSGDAATGRRLLDAVTSIAPSYAEAWHQRGKMQAASGDNEGALVSLNKAVTLNPRHFVALAELGSLLMEYGDKRDALKSFRKALALDPHFENLDREVQKLARDVEGEKI
jgi:Flp pilus assembly protein TadD